MSLVIRSCLLLSVLSVVLAAPKRATRAVLPTWYLPCGEEMEIETLTTLSLEEELMTSLTGIKVQHQLAMNDYLHRDYEFLYERVRIGVHEHQYIPNWIPGKRDVNMIKRLVNHKPQFIVNHFPKLHEDLQKFAVAFEELVEDETNHTIRDALQATQSYLMRMLCEVEANIVTQPSFQVPYPLKRVPRSIMNKVERDPVDDTRRLIRDWGVLLKYKDYLHAWRHVFNY